MTKKIQLNAPESYYKLSKEEKQKITNKCGPSGFLSKLVPDSLLGLDISESCNIHDYMFHQSSKQNEFKIADKTFLTNMNLQIKESSTILSPIRKIFSHIYYGVVRIYSFLGFGTKNN